jgi:hypothetical protein
MIAAGFGGFGRAGRAHEAAVIGCPELQRSCQTLTP